MRRIYLDNAATAFPKAPGTGDAIRRYIDERCVSLYRTESSLAEDSFDILLSLRTMLAKLFNYPHQECIAFTRSITESMNWIIKGLFCKGDHIIVSSNEHNAVMRPINQCGIEYSRLNADREGFNDYSGLEDILQSNTKGIIINVSGNVSGAIQDLAPVADFAKKHSILFIVDTAQAAPSVDIDMSELGIAAFGFTGHKGFLGPEGTGGMILRRDTAEAINPLIAGGTGSESDREELPRTLPERLSPGTENMPGLAGLEEAMRYTLKHLDEIRAKERRMTELLYEGLTSIKDVEIRGPGLEKPRNNVISITVKGRDEAEIAALLLERGNIETRVGLHCSPSAHKTIGTFPSGTLRFSPGPFTAEEDIEVTIKTLKEILDE